MSKWVFGKRYVAAELSQWTMPGVKACRFDRAHCFDEALDLDLEVERFQAVRCSKMSEAALKLQGTMEAYLVKEFHDTVVMHANTIPARVDGQMIRSLQTLRISSFRIGNGKFGRVNPRA